MADAFEGLLRHTRPGDVQPETTRALVGAATARPLPALAPALAVSVCRVVAGLAHCGDIEHDEDLARGPTLAPVSVPRPDPYPLLPPSHPLLGSQASPLLHPYA